MVEAAQVSVEEEYMDMRTARIVKAVTISVGLATPALAGTNTLVGYSGLGDLLSVGGISYPRVTLTPGYNGNPANVADGVIQFITGKYNPPIQLQRGYIDFIPQNFTNAGVRPLCFFQFDHYWVMTATTNPVSLQSLDATSSNVFAVDYHLDGNGRWHVVPYFTYRFDLNQTTANHKVPWQINFHCQAR
jgi:hypothetical protein